MSNFVKKKIPMPLPAGATLSAAKWAANSKPSGPTKPPPKAPPTAQPADDPRGSVVMRSVDDLRPHPLQATYFNDQPAAQFAEFVVEIADGGIKEPIEILPDDTVISGHQRLRAARRLGWDEVPVIIRYDLAAAGEAAVELALIQANRHRRQLSKIEQARCYKRVRELKIESGESFGRGELRDQYAKQFGMSGRNLDRYAELLGHPKELQDAVDRKQLPLIKALQLMQLTPEEYEPVLQMLREGLNVRKAVSQLGLGFERSPITPKKLARFLRDWVRLTELIDEHKESIAPLVLPHQKRWLVAVQSLGAELLAASEEAPEAVDQDEDDDPVEDVEAGDDELAEEGDDAE